MESKRVKYIKIVYRAITIISFVVGIMFSYLIAELDDAPGVIIIGTSISLVFSAIVYGIGELVVENINKNIILNNIYNKLNNK